MKSKCVLITGCAGFIGSHASDFFLSKKYNVVGVDCFTYASNKTNMSNSFKNKNFYFYNANICETDKIKSMCKKHNVEWIINFAAETHVDNSIKQSENFIRSNILGVKSLLDVCKELPVNFFQISTDEVYGSTDSGEFCEKSRLNPTNPYSATKAAAEHYVKAYSNTYGVDHIIVRPTNNIGHRQHSEKFFPTILRSLENNQKIPLYGSGKQTREWLYVEDNVKAIEFILRFGKLGEIYNIGSKNEIKNIDLLHKVCQIKNLVFDDVVSFVDDRPGHDNRYAISNEKLRNLGYDDYLDLDQILKKMLLGEK